MKRRAVKAEPAVDVGISKEVFKAEVTAWAEKMKVEPKEVHVRPMRSKWGSCSTAGRVTFDAELLAPDAVEVGQLLDGWACDLRHRTSHPA